MKKKVTMKELMERFLTEAKKKFPKSKIKKIDASSLDVTFGEAGIVCTLENLQEEINTRGLDIDEAIKFRLEILRKTSTIMPKTKAKKAITKSDVKKYAMLCVKTRTWLEGIVPNISKKNKIDEEKAKESCLFWRPLTDELGVVITLDYPDFMMFLPRSQIKEIGLSEQEIEEIAMKNNLNRDYETQLDTMDLDGITVNFMSNPEDPNMHNLLCTPKKIAEKLNHKECMAIMPFRDVLLYKETSNKKDDLTLYTTLWSTAKSAIARNLQPYPISETPFVIKSDGRIAKYDFSGFPKGVKGVLAMLKIDKKTGKKEITGAKRFTTHSDEC